MEKALNKQTAKAEQIRKGQICNANGDFVNENELPKTRQTIRVIALKRYEMIKGHENKNGLTVVTATDTNGNILPTIFVSAALAEHRAISLLCLGSAEFREFTTLENPAKWLSISAIDYDKLTGFEYWNGNEWVALNGLNIQFAEEVEPNEESAADIFKRKFGIEFDITNEHHCRMIEKFL